MIRRQEEITTSDRHLQSVRACLAWFLAWLLTATFFSGCSRDRGPERIVVSGAVTYNGKPLSHARIRFIPAEASVVPMAGAPIDEGKYRVDGGGGVPVGTHQIQIEAYRTDQPCSQPGQSASPSPRSGGRQQYLPKRYNRESQLQITIQPDSSEIIKNFDLTD
jgi:hypothetical protein